jgi:phenylalanine ammonia-lyase
MELGLNVGLKSLQLSCNALMPLIGFYGQSMTDRFPTHAEQFNQNINSQAMNAANLARDQLDILEHFMANVLVFGMQAVELRAHAVAGTYDARAVLSPATQALYVAAREASSAGLPAGDRPLVWNDTDSFIEPKVQSLMQDFAARGRVFEAMANVRESLRERITG